MRTQPRSEGYSDAVLSRASRGTGSALDEIFGFPSLGNHEAANAVDQSLATASAGPTTLAVANRLFPDVQFTPLPAFLDTAAKRYGATIQPIESSDAEGAAGTINDWVSETTRGLIPTIADAETVRDVELLLVNTVYLKADWSIPFLPELTSEGVFTTADGAEARASFMRDHEAVDHRFLRMPDADVVELPYEGGELRSKSPNLRRRTSLSSLIIPSCG